MGTISKILALLLLLDVATALLLAQQLGSPGTNEQPAAVCHQHSDKPPVPHPGGHACCQVGHHPAVLQQSLPSPSRSVLLYPANSIEFGRPSADDPASSRFKMELILPGDTPHANILRI
jgi:hypothetical protein